MAVDIIDPNDPNKNKDQSGTASTSPTSVSPVAPPPAAGSAPAQPGSGVNTTGQGPQAAPSQKATGRTGSGFVNLQNVISANRQNRLGSTVNQGMQQVANNVRQNLGMNQQVFQQELDKNRLGTAQDVQNRQNVINRITNYQAPTTVNAGGNATFDEKTGEFTTPPVQQAPTGADLVNQDDINAFQKYQSGVYQGPQSLRDLDMLHDQAQRVESLGKNTTSTGGRQTLLQQFIGAGNNDYTRGKQALDSLLLGQTGAKDLKQARQATFGLDNKITGAENLAEQESAAAASLAQQFGTDTKSLLGDDEKGGLIGDIYGNIKGTVEQRQNQAKADYEAFKQRVANKDLTEDDVKLLQQLGVDENTDLYDLAPHLAEAFDANNDYNLSNVADQTQSAKYNALTKLAGKQSTIDLSKAGTAQGPLVQTDLGKQFSDLLKSKQSAYDETIKPFQPTIDQYANDYSTINPLIQQAKQDYSKNVNILNDPNATQEQKNAALNIIQGKYGIGMRGSRFGDDSLLGQIYNSRYELSGDGHQRNAYESILQRQNEMGSGNGMQGDHQWSHYTPQEQAEFLLGGKDKEGVLDRLLKETQAAQADWERKRNENAQQTLGYLPGQTRLRDLIRRQNPEGTGTPTGK
jgi:hypothetical protein